MNQQNFLEERHFVSQEVSVTESNKSPTDRAISRLGAMCEVLGHCHDRHGQGLPEENGLVLVRGQFVEFIVLRLQLLDLCW